MNAPIAEKVALVTGAGSGIGEATAVLLAERGAAVAIGGRSKEKLDRVAERIAAQGGQVLPVIADVSEPSHVQAAVERTVNTFGALHSPSTTPAWPARSGRSRRSPSRTGTA